jgi:hypothetical protein
MDERDSGSRRTRLAVRCRQTKEDCRAQIPSPHAAERSEERARVIGANHRFPHVCPGFHHREHRDHRDGSEGKKGSEPDPKPFLSGLCGLCGETPDRAVCRQGARELWLASMGARVRGKGRARRKRPSPHPLPGSRRGEGVACRQGPDAFARAVTSGIPESRSLV